MSDQGIGIPQPEIGSISDRFYRASNVSSRIDGASFGLTGVRHITERHQGTVSVESVLGEGSTFMMKRARQRSTDA